MESHGPRRYVVQQHELSAFRHWDLMLEQDETLATWQLTVPPELVAAAGGDQGSGDGGQGPIASEGVAATRLPDHRKAYLEYEGPVSGDRGVVHIVDSGTYILLAAGETEWLVEFAGHVLRGRFRLARRAGDARDWRLIRCRDDAAGAARCGT